MMQSLSPPDRQNAGLDLAAALAAFEPITLDALEGSDANLPRSDRDGIPDDRRPVRAYPP